MDFYSDLLARLNQGIRLLPDKPEENAENTLQALWLTAAGHPCSVEHASGGVMPALDAPQARALQTLVERRLSGEPVAYLTGRQRFMDLEMHAAPGALIPRKETEILGRAALGLIHEAASSRGQATVVDVCTGAGNLALAYAAHEPRARVFAADLSADAIAVAEENGRTLGLTGRVDFRTGDLLEPFGPDLEGTVDVLSCNPPYISTARLGTMAADIVQYEPRLAFDGGAFGVTILARVIRDGLRLLRPGGWLCLEVGLGQGPAMARRLVQSGAYGEPRSFADTAGEVRALAAQVKSR